MKLLEALSKLIEAAERGFISSITEIPPEFDEALALGGKHPIGDMGIVKHAFQMEGVDFEPVGVAVTKDKEALYIGCMRFLTTHSMPPPEAPEGGYPPFKRDKYGIPDYNGVGIILLRSDMGAYLDSLFIKSSQQSQGNVAGFMLRIVSLFEVIGLEYIRIEAAYVGRYTWYTMGFRPEDETDYVDFLNDELSGYVPWALAKAPTTLGEFLGLTVDRQSFKRFLAKSQKAAARTHQEFLDDVRFLRRGERGNVEFRLGKYFIIYQLGQTSNWESVMPIPELKARLTRAKGGN